MCNTSAVFVGSCSVNTGMMWRSSEYSFFWFTVPYVNLFHASFLLAHHQLQALATSGMLGSSPNAGLGTSLPEHTPAQPSVSLSVMAGQALQAPSIPGSVQAASLRHPLSGSLSDHSSVTPIPPMHLPNGTLLHADFAPLIEKFHRLVSQNSPLAAEPARQESINLAREDAAADQHEGYGGLSRTQHMRNSNVQPYSPPITRHATGYKGRSRTRTVVVKKSMAQKAKQPVPAMARYLLCLLLIVVSTDDSPLSMLECRWLSFPL